MTTKRDIRLIVCIVAGFTQSRHEVHGMSALNEALACEHFDRRNSIIMLEHWDQSGELLADKIAHYCGTTTRVALIGYSWGNPTIDHIEKRLDEYGIKAAYRAYVDPVTRASRHVLWPGNLIALTKLGSFKRLGAKIIDLWRQTNDRPLGRTVKDMHSGDGHWVFQSRADKPIKGATAIHNPSIGHNTIDDHPMILNAIRARIEALLAA